MGEAVYSQSGYDAAIKRRILANAHKTFTRTYADYVAVEDFVRCSRSPFFSQLADSLDKFGKLSPAQVECVRKAIAQRDDPVYQQQRRDAREAAHAEAIATCAHVGKEGERITRELTVYNIVQYQTESFGYGDSGIRYIFLLRDADANVFKYQGTADCMPGRDETKALTFTIKRHDAFKGQKQTVIARPAIAKTKNPTVA